VSHLFGQWLVGIQFAYVVVSLQVGHGVASGRFADGVLVNKLDVGGHLYVTLEAEVFARPFAGFAIFALQGTVEYVAHKGTLSRSAHTRHHRHHVQREAHVDALQVVFACTLHLYIVIPRAMCERWCNHLFAQQIFHRVAVASWLQVAHVAFIDNLSAQASGLRTYVDDVVGRTDNLFVVLHHHHGIAQLLQLAEHTDKFLSVAAMEADARLVQYVERPHQAATERGGQIDALAFTTRQGVAQSAQGEVTKSYIHQEAEAVVDFRHQAFGHGGIVFVQLQVQEEGLQLCDRQLHQFGYRASAYLHVQRLFLQSGTPASGANGLSAITGQHHAVLDFVLIFLQHLEERVDASLGALAVPQEILLCLGEVVVWFKDGEIMFGSPSDKLLLPFAHFFASPADNGSVVHTQCRVGHHQCLVDAYHPSETFALGTCTDGRVEREQLVGGLFKLDAVGLELLAEGVEQSRRIEAHQTGAVTFVESRFGRVNQAADGARLIAYRQTVDEEVEGSPLRLLLQILLDAHHLAIHLHTCKTLLEVDGKLLLHCSSGARHYGAKHRKACAGRKGQHALHQVIGRMFLHQLATDG